jgi:hypothetical protein
MTVDPKTPVGELTVLQVLNHLSARCPSIACGYLLPDDGGTLETHTFRSGCRVAYLGLSLVLQKVAMNDLMKRGDDAD